MVEEALVDSLRQEGSGVRFDWGATAAGLARGPGAVVIVDVLSFTTAVSVATGRGAAVAPFALADEGAAELAARLGAVLAVPRRQKSPEHPWTLSPSALMTAPHTTRLVLPSPNGSAIAAAIAGAEPYPDDESLGERPDVVAGCLRNVTATATWLLSRGYGTAERPVWLIGAGERWPDGSLRPALEDQLGTGALAGTMARAGCRLSPEAEAVARTYRSTPDLGSMVADCASGRELVAMGFPDEAGIASALDADDHVAVMDGGLFVRA